MFGFYASRNQYTLWKFLIDKHFQNKGYGKSALLIGIAQMKQCFDIKEIYTGVIVNNQNAKRLYESCGFIKTGLIENGIEEMVLTLD